MTEAKDIKAQRQEFTRKAIIDAARGIIIREGADALTARKLAEAVGYSPATLYKYFEGMDTIVEAVRAEGWSLMAEMSAGEDFSGMSPREMLLLNGRVFQEFAGTYPEHYLLMFGSAQADPMSYKELFSDPGFHALIAMIQWLANEGKLRLGAYTATQLALHVFLLSHGIAMMRITLMRESEIFDEISQGVLAAFADNLLADD